MMLSTLFVSALLAGPALTQALNVRYERVDVSEAADADTENLAVSDSRGRRPVRFFKQFHVGVDVSVSPASEHGFTDDLSRVEITSYRNRSGRQFDGWFVSQDDAGRFHVQSVPPSKAVGSLGVVGNPFEVPVGMTEDIDPVKIQRVDLALGVVSISAAMVATGLTASCLAAKTCHETVPLTRWAFDHGPVWGVVGRAAVNGVIHYAVARWVPLGKWRTLTLAALAGINVTNAVLDIRTLQQIERNR